MKYAILYILFAIIAIDALGAMLWIASGQVPADNIFIGAMTKNLLSIIIGQ